MHLFERTDPLDAAARSYGAQIAREAAMYNIPVSLTPDTVDWDTIFAAEAALLRGLPEPELRRRAWIIYDRYAEVAGAERAARRAAANSLNVETCAVDVLRADLLQVQNEIARLYTIGFQVERQRADLTRFVLTIAVVALAAFFAFLAWVSLKGKMNPNAEPWVLGAIGALAVIGLLVYSVYRRRRRAAPAAMAFIFLSLFIVAPAFASPSGGVQPPAAASTPRVPVVPIVIISGILGATFSVLQRVQRSSAGDPLATLLSLRAARPQVFLSIVSGAIASLVLYAIFAGGMIKGDLFPTIVNVHDQSDGKEMLALYHFLRDTGPLTHADHAKMLVWAFIGGFAERLVPDILDRFSASAKK